MSATAKHQLSRGSSRHGLEAVRSRGGEDAAVWLVHGSGDPGAGAGRIFRLVWQYVGHTGQLARARLLRHRAWSPPVVVTRTDGEPRGFVNVCRHRGSSSPRAREPQDAAVPVPRLDVRARRPPSWAPRSDRLPARRGRTRPGAARALGPVPLRERRRRCRAARGLARPGPCQVAELGLDVDALVHHRAGSRARRRTGRSSRENFLECYHCAVAHPASPRSSTSHPRRTCSRPTGGLSTQHGPPRTSTPRRAAARPVPLPLAEPRDQHLPRTRRTSRSARSSR